MPYTLLLIVLGILVGHISFVEAHTNITIDNTSPLVVYSPTPCFQQNTPNCSTEWQLSENAADFNGSATSTTGPNLAQGLTVVARVSLVFQGSSIIFVPGQNSTAQVIVVVDNLSSILVDTTSNAFSGTGLDPSTNHIITITFVPRLTPTTLEVDYFFIELLDANTASTSTPSSSIFTTTPLPTALPSTTTLTTLPTSLSPSSASTFHQSPPTLSPTFSPTRSNALPAGTIAAISLSAVLALLSSLAVFTIPRVRRWVKKQFHRDRNLDHDNPQLMRVRRQTEKTKLPWKSTQEIGKERGRERISVPPRTYYTPRRVAPSRIHNTPWRERNPLPSLSSLTHDTPWRERNPLPSLSSLMHDTPWRERNPLPSLMHDTPRLEHNSVPPHIHFTPQLEHISEPPHIHFTPQLDHISVPPHIHFTPQLEHISEPPHIHFTPQLEHISEPPHIHFTPQLDHISEPPPIHYQYTS